MAQQLRQIGTDFLDGLIEAWTAIRRRVSPAPQARARIEDDALLVSIGGDAAGRIGFDASATPPDLLQRLAGHRIEVEIPSDWAVQKSLPPTTKEGLAFLPDFVAYQIERITPWRTADVAYHIETAPIPGDKDRLSVEVLVLPKLRIARALALLSALPGTRVLLVVAQGSGRRAIALDAAGDLQPMMLWRRRTAFGLAAALLLALLLAGELLWEIRGLGREVADLDGQIATRRALLRRVQSGSSGQAQDSSALADLPPRVRTIEDLSRTLPDDAYLTALTMRGDHLQVSGFASHAAQLVPTLEQSKHFAAVAFAGAITRADQGRRDRFQLEMRIAHGDAP